MSFDTSGCVLAPPLLPVRPVLLPAHHRQTRLRFKESKYQQVARSSQLTAARTACRFWSNRLCYVRPRTTAADLVVHDGGGSHHGHKKPHNPHPLHLTKGANLTWSWSDIQMGINHMDRHACWCNILNTIRMSCIVHWIGSTDRAKIAATYDVRGILSNPAKIA